MSFTIKTRYGATKSYSDNSDIPAIVESLIRELETEQFDEPDDEHTQVAIEHSEWAVTVSVSGLMVLDDLSWITGDPDDVPGLELFKRAASREEAVAMLTMIALGQVDRVRAAKWVPRDHLPPWERDLFRK
jgi:hypothetical protein